MHMVPALCLDFAAAGHDTSLSYDANIAHTFTLPAFSLASLGLVPVRAQECFRPRHH